MTSNVEAKTRTLILACSSAESPLNNSKTFAFASEPASWYLGQNKRTHSLLEEVQLNFWMSYISLDLANATSTFTVVNHSSPTFLPFESTAGLSCFICSSPGVPAQTDGANRLPLNQTAPCSRAYNISPFGPPSGAVEAFILDKIGTNSSVT